MLIRWGDLRNYRIKVTFEKVHFYNKAIDSQTRTFGKLPSAPLPVTVRLRLLREGVNTSFAFLWLERFIKFLGMKSNTNGGLCPNPASACPCFFP